MKQDIFELEKFKRETLEKKNTLEEINNLTITNDNIILKNPQNIYFDLYFKAKEIAENKKKEALNAYLELNEIKNKIILNDY